MADREECYKILGLNPGASQEEIRRAYRDLAKVWHPDRFPNDPRLQRKAQEELRKINEACDRLLQPWRRWRDEPGADQAKTPAGEAGLNSSQTDGGSPTRGAFWTAPVKKSHAVVWLTLTALFASSFVLYQLMRQQPPAPTIAPPPAAAKEQAPPKVGITPAAVAPKAETPSKHKEKPVPAEVYFTLGSSPSEVLAVQGRPTKSDDLVWEYGPSKVFFQSGRVASWYSAPSARLRVRLRPGIPVTVRGYFTLGSSKDEVLAAQGTPTEFSDTVYHYGSSRVHFRDGVVDNWLNTDGNPLKVRFVPTGQVYSYDYFTVGSTSAEVAAVQGTPTELGEGVWHYGLSKVYFRNGRVTKWESARTDPLKARIISK